RNPSTLVVDVGSLSDGGGEEIAAVSRLPQVASARSYAAFLIAAWGNDGPDFSQDFEALGSLDGRFFDQDTFTPTSGRLPDPSRPDEIAVNETAAEQYGYHVGQRIDLGTVSGADLGDPDFEKHPTPRLLTHATIVGVGSFIEEVVQDDTDRSRLILLTPAYVRQAEGLATYAWLGLVLKHGDADVAAVKQWIVQNQTE